MRKIVHPKQKMLFDSFNEILTDSWAGVFRNVIVELMPVDAIGKHFNKSTGRPTKELYSIAGPLLMKEFKNLTVEEAVNAYL